MARPTYLLTLPLVLALYAGTCLAQEKPQEPTDPEEQKKQELEKAKQENPASTGTTVIRQPAPVLPTPAPAPGANQPPAGGATNGKPLVAPSEIGAQPKSLDTPVPQDVIRLGPFTDEVDVKLLVKLVQEELKIQIISTDAALRDKKVSLMPNAIEMKRSELLAFLQLLLEQNGQILTRDVAGVWIIKAQTDLASGLPGAEDSTTQVISTIGLKPTSLQNAITQGLRSTGGTATGPLAYLDDLGVIVITDTPRRINAVKALIAKIAAEQMNAEIARFDLKYIAAPVARVRLLEMVGQFTRSIVPTNVGDPNAAQINQQAAGGGPGGSPNTANLASRLIVNPQGNGLLFRGRPDERAFLEKLIPIVDAPNELEPRYYDITAPIVIAEQASRQGLGELKVMRSQREGIQQTGAINNPNLGQVGGQQQFGSSNAITEIGGPCFIIDPEGRGFMYYGTPEQHARLGQIVEQFRVAVQTDTVVYEFYKLKHASALDTAEVIRGLIANQAVGGASQSGLLPGGRSPAAAANRRPTTANITQQQANTPTRATTPGSTNELGEIVASEDIFVQADERNNQLVVKAPKRLQPQFAKLIEKLDLRRAQVYIDAKIVVVTDTDSFRLAVEMQLLNSGGTGGALRTLFTPSAMLPAAGSGIGTFPVITPLTGATAAVIKTGSVAATITAIANTTDGRIVATPQLLVDDNEEAEVASLEQRPTSTQTQSSGSGSTLTGFGGFEDAGPKLKVKPRISTSNSLSIDYEIELSSFVGDPPAEGLPPAKQKNNIKSKSVTLPSDSTLVVGGLTFNQNDKTVVKVPLLGDIPIIGQLFRDERHLDNRRILYVFITPRIMRDQGFDDLRLNTEGPASSVRVTDPLPPPRPAMIPITEAPVPMKVSPAPATGWSHPKQPTDADPPRPGELNPAKPGSVDTPADMPPPSPTPMSSPPPSGPAAPSSRPTNRTPGTSEPPR